MIEVIIEAEIARRDDERIDRQDGNDAIRGRVTTTRTETVRIHLELHGVDERGGYVNLEGYAPSSAGMDWQDEVVARYVDLDRDDEVLEADFELRGEVEDWIGAANRYLDERPDMDLVDALELFKSWDETPDRTIEKAIEEIRQGVTA